VISGHFVILAMTAFGCGFQFLMQPLSILKKTTNYLKIQIINAIFGSDFPVDKLHGTCCRATN